MDADAHTPSTERSDRLAWLLRSSLRQRQVHPLLHLLEEHRHATGVLERPLPAAPPPNPWLVHAPLDLTDAQRHLAHLPARPAVVRELVRLLRSEAVHADDIAACVERDPALAARTLRLANSPFYGVAGRVGTLREAVQVLGFDAVTALQTMSAMQEQLAPLRCDGFDPGGFWQHALATAVTARAVVQMLPPEARLDEDEAFAAGLLHDIGVLLLVSRFGSQASTAMDHGRRSDLPLHAAEREVLGCDHAQIGALLATHWHFRPVLCEAIERHHAPAEADDQAAPTLADAVHAADALVHGLDLGRQAHELVPPVDLAAWQRLRLCDERCLALLAQTESVMAEWTEEVAP